MHACLPLLCLSASLTSLPALAASDVPAAQASLTDRAMFTIPGFPSTAQPALHVRAELLAWYMAPGGELRLPRASGASTTLDIDPFGFDTPQLTPVPEVNVFSPARDGGSWLARKGWRVGGRAFVFGDDHSFVAPTALQLGERSLDAGESARVSLDYASAELEAGVNLYSYVSDTTDPLGNPDVSSSLEAIVGVQAIDCTWRVTIDNLVQEAGDTSVGPLVGGKLAFAFTDRFLVDVTITASTSVLGDDMVAADVHVGGTYWFSRNVGLQIGYRSAFFSLSGDEGGTAFDYSGSHQGLMVGIAARF
jgi:hypothetical protein